MPLPRYVAQKNKSGTAWDSGRQEDAFEFLISLLAVLEVSLV